ncbi:helicase [Schizophyllum commune H4-8]|uniref:helicase n=1 Tax=Schizophyllum commune (strain H4-8 / FGSC 9210) TaxID=578458 RepID=UPI0021600F49|nr:helicase [Schizophyllum commune H4-8]KAI5888541.1 helicase [Schizophyllum commune H4-8]
MSINKAQGQSVKYVGLDLRSPVFTHGQLYVALSRATASHNIKVLIDGDSNANTVQNVVYPEVLLD